MWVSSGITESGDDLKILIWHHKPLNDEVNLAYKQLYPTEYEVVGYVNFNITEAIDMENNNVLNPLY